MGCRGPLASEEIVGTAVTAAHHLIWPQLCLLRVGAAGLVRSALGSGKRNLGVPLRRWIRPGDNAPMTVYAHRQMTGGSMYTVRRLLLAMTVAGAGVTAAAPVANADRLPAPGHVVVRLAKTGVHAPDSLRAGRYKVEVRVPSRRPGMLILLKPDRGYTRAEMRADARSAVRGSRVANRRIRENLRYFGGVATTAGGSGALWETLYAGRYWLVGFTSASRPAFETVHVHGTPSVSRFPRVTASVTTKANRLQATRFVPQSGRILVRNNGRGIDSLFMLRLTKGSKYDDFVHWAHHPRSQPPFGLRGLRSTAALSRGAGYVLRYRMRPGRYVVMESQTVRRMFGRFGTHVERVRQVTRPLNVRATGAAHRTRRTRARLHQAAETQAAPYGWLTPRARKLLQDSGLSSVAGLPR
jgi:hypothetical protein